MKKDALKKEECDGDSNEGNNSQDGSSFEMIDEQDVDQSNAKEDK